MLLHFSRYPFPIYCLHQLIILRSVLDIEIGKLCCCSSIEQYMEFHTPKRTYDTHSPTAPISFSTHVQRGFVFMLAEGGDF